MTSRNRDIANFLGKTETANTGNESLLSTADGGGLTVYATLNDLPTTGLTSGDQAYITSTNRIYVSNGSGWYNVALINATPSLSIDPTGSVTLATDGSTPTVITLTGTDSDNADANLIYSVESDGSFANIATLSQDSSVFTITPLAEGSATPGSSTLTFKVSDGISFGSGTTEFSLTFAPDWTATPTESKILASDAQASDNYGEKIAISGDGAYVIVGAYFEDTPASSAGAAYILARSGSTWTQQAKIQSSDIAQDDRFGYSVDINSDGTYAVVGAYLEDTTADRAGTVYIFTRSGSTWTQQAKIQATDASSLSFFGSSVSMNPDGTYIIVGAEQTNSGTGASYIFTRSGSTWTQQAKLTASDGASGDYFSRGVSINSDGTYAVVGAERHSNVYTSDGAAYIFTRSGSIWTQQAKLVPSDAEANDYFGRAVSISSDGTYVIISAYLEDSNGTGNGAAYIFTRSGSTWTQQAKLMHSDPSASNDFLGWSVSINSNGDHAIVSAHARDRSDLSIFDVGAAYLFSRSGSTWTQIKKLEPSDITQKYYGKSVSINSNGSYIAIGAPLDSTAANQAGAAYIYEAS